MNEIKKNPEITKTITTTGLIANVYIISGYHFDLYGIVQKVHSSREEF